jgi:hypothetical protein
MFSVTIIHDLQARGIARDPSLWRPRKAPDEAQSEETARHQINDKRRLPSTVRPQIDPCEVTDYFEDGGYD